VTAAQLCARAVVALREAVKASSKEDLPALLSEVERVRVEALLSAQAHEASAAGQVLTPRELADRLGRSVDWVYRERHSLPTIPLPGGRWGVPEARLERWIQRRGR
jgi:hypothetical protein